MDPSEAELIAEPEVDEIPDLEAPLLLYCVFGLPVFLTVIWFFLRFTRPDRFGRVDRDALPPAEPPQEPPAAEPEDSRS